MSQVIIKDLSLNYPMYGANSRSIKNTLLKVTSGGKISTQDNKMVVISALKNINLSLKSGDRLALIGHNGAGKSTLLRTIAGIYTQTSGSIEIEGRVNTLLDLSLGMVPEVNGYENIKLRAALLNLPKSETDKLINEIEEFTEMGSFLSMPVHSYSAGMMVRLSFALSTIVSHDIFLIDEVVGTGDASFIKKAQARMEGLIYQSEILMLASHSVEIIRKFCNKALWLEHGEVKAYGELEEVLIEFEKTI